MMSNEEAIIQLEILLTNITGTVGDGKLSPSLIILAGKTIEALERAKLVLGDKDLVKVVRCKNCRYRGTEECGMSCECDYCEGPYSWETDNDFCSYGGREESK